MIVLVSNTTVANYLKHKLLTHHLTETNSSSMATGVYPINQWVQQQWENLVDSAHPLTFDSEQSLTLLSPIQVRAIWAQVLQQFKDELPDINQQHLIELVAGGWDKLQQGALDQQQLKQRLSYYEQDADIKISRWIERFNWILKKNHYCTQPQVWQKLSEYYQSSDYQPQPIRLIDCPIRIAPKLLKMIDDASTELTIEPLKTCEASVTVTEFDQQPEEVEFNTAIHWAVAKVGAQAEPEPEPEPKAEAGQEPAEPATPAQTISIIIPNLVERYDVIQRLVNQYDDSIKSKIAIGGAFKLESSAEFNTFKLILRWVDTGLNFAETIELIRSPFWLLQQHQTQRALLEIGLYNRSRYNPFSNPYQLCKLQSLYSYFEKILNPKIANPLLEKLASIIEFANTKQPSKQSPTQWLQYFTELSTQVGWVAPQIYSQGSKNPIAELVTEQFEQLEVILKTCNRQQAIEWFKQIAQKSIPRPLGNKPIRIIDTAEGAVGSEAIWLCSANNHYWPSPLQQHLLIANGLLQETRMPRSSSQLELAMCKHLLSQLEENSSQVIYSYCKNSSDPDIAISPLLEDKPQTPLSTLLTTLLPSLPRLPSIATTQLTLESIEDQTAPPMSANERQQTKGGAGLVKAIGNCPFSAFVEYRLQTRPMMEPPIGIDPLQRGNFVHEAMQWVWGSVINCHQQLADYSEEQLQQCCNTTATQVIDNERQHKRYHPLLLDIEQQRLSTLLYRWLTLEQRRPSFKVESVETPIQLTIGGLNLMLRVDRIDCNENDERLIIDYKTSKDLIAKPWTVNIPNTREIDLTSDRIPPEPQLPLYIMAAEQPAQVTAIAIAQLSTKKIALKGLCTDSSSHQSWAFENIQAVDWQAHCDYWHRSIETAVNHFRMGDISIAPRPNKTKDHYTPIHRQLTGVES